MKNILQSSPAMVQVGPISGIHGSVRRLSNPLIALAFIAVAGVSLAQLAPPLRPIPKDKQVEKTSSASPIWEEIVYNEDVPPLVTDPDLLKALKLHGSQWIQQSLIWPSVLERRIHAGISSYDQRAAMVAWLDAAFVFKPLPPEITLNAVEMRNWLVLYSDWARYSGADAFIVRFTNRGYAIHVTEAATHIVLMARPEKNVENVGDDPKMYALSVADRLFRPYLLAKNPELAVAEKIPNLPGAWEGSWQPGGEGRIRRPLAPEMPPLAIRFFVVGDFVAFSIDKNVWNNVDNPMLYSKRFKPPQQQESEMEILQAIQDETLTTPNLADPAERIIFYERLRQQLNIKTVEEFLGPMLYDSQGERLTSKNLDYQRLLSVVENLNQDQRQILLRQRQVDSFYVEGLKAFEEDDLELALHYWTRALDTDPLNVRINVLLQVALAIKVEREYAGDYEAASHDAIIRNIRDLQAHHRKSVLRDSVDRFERERLEKDIEELRAQGVELFQQGMFRESMDVWNKILRRDPDNATAALWLATIRSRLNDPTLENAILPGSSLKQRLNAGDKKTTSTDK